MTCNLVLSEVGTATTPEVGKWVNGRRGHYDEITPPSPCPAPPQGTRFPPTPGGTVTK